MAEAILWNDYSQAAKRVRTFSFLRRINEKKREGLTNTGKRSS